MPGTGARPPAPTEVLFPKPAAPVRHRAVHNDNLNQTIDTMKTTVLLPLTALFAIASVHAQGPLSPPPGAPAPVMKSLDQVEARIPLVAGQAGVSINGTTGAITISQAGSYYLTGNLTLTAAGASGIVITSSNVTLDLNGFALIHTTGNGGHAVSINAANVTVRNGTVRGGSTVSDGTFTHAGWNEGITAGSNFPNLVAEDISVSGVRSHGINLSYEGSMIERCVVHTVGEMGLYASSISFSTARKTGGTAIAASSDPDSGSVSNCFGETVSTSGHGIYAADGAVDNCRGIAKAGIGIMAETAINCFGTSNSNTGLNAAVSNNCRGVSTSGTGITGSSAMHCYGASTSGTGISVTLATSCTGSRPGGTAIQVTTANGCHVQSGTVSATNKYNMP